MLRNGLSAQQNLWIKYCKSSTKGVYTHEQYNSKNVNW